MSRKKVETLGDDKNRLIFGVFDEKGKVHTNFTHKPKVTARIRKDLADPNLKKNPGKVTTKFLATMLETLGPYKEEKITEDLVCSLTSVDREYVSMVIVKNVTQPKKFFPVVCQACKADDIEYPYDLNSIPVLRPATDLAKEGLTIEQDTISGQHIIVYNVEYADLDLDAKMCLADGFTEEEIYPFLSGNPEDALIRNIANLLQSLNGKTGKAIEYEKLQDEDIDVIDVISEEMGAMKERFGIQLNPIVRCPTPGCGAQAILDTRLTDFLLRFRPQTKKA
jgi:hypothetical protein